MFRHFKLASATITKKLEPKNGYDRIKWNGRIINYRENEIVMIKPVFSNDVIEGEANAFDDNGNYYKLSFVYRRKKPWVYKWFIVGIWRYD